MHFQWEGLNEARGPIVGVESSNDVPKEWL